MRKLKLTPTHLHKLLKLGRIGEFLSKALSPPDAQTVRNAIDDLTRLNALDENENLTALG